MDVNAGAPTALTIPFLIGTQPVPPDVGSVKYTLKDQLGAPMVGLTDIPYLVAPGIFQIQILVPSSAHQITPGRRFERRTVVVDYKAGGEEVQLIRTYRIVPEPLHTVRPADVRSFIGIEEHEMPDEDIDVLSAYLVVEKEVGADVLTQALSSGTTDELAGNMLIRMRAVLDVLPSAKQRMAQSEQNGVKQFSRVDLKELDKLKDEAERRYREAIDTLVITTETAVTFFLTTTNTDAITG
ncbi:hypothetical protein [Rhizobium sp. Leaf383]|uniref:hypothetical protein n=1 Tax=Rhizobium sp. Leaf383 TaxID=1736357 RepID=UPI000716036B|nr:hypothetical protein [Rhizobium sp. Leaf383]KQS84259.1 hypothetical protein ASG58_21045 [Rhizobium sp. Leaf383]